MAITKPSELLDTILVENSLHILELERRINDALKHAKMIDDISFTIQLKTGLDISLAEKMLKEAGYLLVCTTRVSHPMSPTKEYKLTLSIPPQGK